MKHLILASLIAVLLLCAAQGARSQTAMSLSRLDVDTITSKHSKVVAFGELLSTQRFISLWDEWRDSCWADSTQYSDYGEPHNLYDERGQWVATMAYTLRWRHRTHDFPGFMDFIGRRTK